MNPSSVNSRLQHAGVAMRKWGPRTNATKHEVQTRVLDSYLSGTTIDAIRLRENVSVSSIRRILRINGVPLNKARPQTIIIPKEQTELAYIAGLFDGEGNLQIRHSTRKGRTSIACKACIYNTNTTVMRWLVGKIGGSLRFDTKRTINKGWLPIGVWSVYRAKDVRALLTALLPFLIIKRPVAVQALQHFEDRFKVHRNLRSTLIGQSSQVMVR